MRSERYRRELNAQRRRRGLESHRLFLYTESGTTQQGLADLAEVTGTDGWDALSRDFDEDGQQPLTIKVARSAGLTAAMLATVAGFAIFGPDDVNAPRYKTDATGIPTLTNEIVWRFVGQRVGGMATVPVADGFTYTFPFALAA